MLGTVELATENPRRARILDRRAGDPTPRDVILTAVNMGQRDMILGGVGLLLPNGNHIPLEPATTTGAIPYRLPADEAFYAWWPARDIAHPLTEAGFKGTIRLGGCCIDQRGRVSCSKRFDFDLDTWGAQGAASCPR
jgi:hypothetical protein